MDAIIYQKAFIGVSKPFFIYNKVNKDVVYVPTIIETGNTQGLVFDPSTDELVTDPTEEGLMAKFEALGLVLPDADTWDHPNRPLRLAIPNDDLTEIIKLDPTVALKVDALKEWIVVRNRTQYIYLEEIYLEDQVAFANYIQSRP
jgi:hypothetical protein